MERLLAGATGIGIPLTPQQLAAFEIYRRELTEWNSRINLTAITEREEVEVRHFLDSLTVALAVPREVLKGGHLVDVGSGGGFPGLPLKIAFPNLELSLVESVGKKARFLLHLVDVLSLRGVSVYSERAELAAHREELRERFDVAVARALAPMPVLLELALPFCRVGGWCIAQKKEDIAEEMAASKGALAELGGRVFEVRPVEIPALSDGRVLVVVEKVAPTPMAYPRRPGMPAKRPLGVR